MCRRGKLLIENGSEGHIVGEWEGGNLLSGADYDKNGQMVGQTHGWHDRIHTNQTEG